MNLSTGTRLGPYEIVEPLGAGGMGEVYKSRDARLGRTVAVKVLANSLGSDRTWRQRFDREARILAALSNPHICPIFDVGSENGINFLVMEYFEGETLRARLDRGPMPLDHALRYAVDIADALAAAHQVGVCHRDLKPANIMLTQSGAKLLDFGVGTLGPARWSDSHDQGTVSAGLTGEGIILGTVQYMAPEQLEGKGTDPRTDIFAFGAVVYEMATGGKAFEGQSQASVIAAVVGHQPPPISSLQAMSPPALDRAVKKCLAKDPEERWQNARDLRDELKWIAEGRSQPGVPLTLAGARKRAPLLPWAVASFSLTALVGLATIHFREQPVDLPRVVVTVPRPATRNLAGATPQLAPDGKQLVFPGPTPDGRSVLWLRSLDSLTSRPLPGSDNQGSPTPFWSPDGRSVGFFSADGKLRKIDVSGGPAQILADAPEFSGGSWNRDGVIVFSPRPGPLFQVSASGGPATPLLELDRSRQETSHSWPSFLPDGRHFLYSVSSTDTANNGVYLGSLDGEKSRLLIRELDGVLYGALYSPPGYILFVRGGTLLAQPFNLRTMEAAGEAIPIPGPGGAIIQTTWGSFSASGNGVLSYASSRAQTVRPTWYDRNGKVLMMIGEAGPYASLVISPDEKRVAVDSVDLGLWLMELGTGVATPLTSKGAAGDPVWSPDGRELVFTFFNGLTANLYHRVIAGGGSEEPFFTSGENKYAQQWLNDGKAILFINEGGKSVYRLPLTSNPKPELLLQTDFAKDEFRLAPDEHWIAYNSLETGRWEVFVTSFPSFGSKRQISNGGGCQPFWRKDGKELFYLTLDGKLMAVDVATSPTFDAGTPRLLFQTPIEVDAVIDQYAATSDGQRFLLATPLSQDSPVTVLLNWTAGLKR